MVATAQQVLILSSNTGGGHRSAAHALEDSFLSLDPGRILVKITQVLEEGTLISRKMADLYNFLLRDHQQLMRYYYWAINKMRPNESRLILEAAMGYGRNLIGRFTPEAIVSVHPMTQHLFAYILRRLGLLGKIPFITVVTDPCSGFWRGWACEDVNHYFVASEDAKGQLIEYGVGSHKITIAGMPVHERFQPVDIAKKPAIREVMGLDPEKFTVFLNSGWAGGGNIPKIYESLAQSGQALEDIQVVFLAGNNEKLLSEAHQIAQVAAFDSKVIGYTDHIEDWMNVSDLIVTKLGGLTTFEAMACQLPIIGDAVTPPMPQEIQTARFIEQSGTGLILTQPDDILSMVQSLKQAPSQLTTMRQRAKYYARLGASRRIAQDVLSLLPAKPIEGHIQVS